MGTPLKILKRLFSTFTNHDDFEELVFLAQYTKNEAERLKRIINAKFKQKTKFKDIYAIENACNTIIHVADALQQAEDETKNTPQESIKLQQGYKQRFNVLKNEFEETLHVLESIDTTNLEKDKTQAKVDGLNTFVKKVKKLLSAYIKAQEWEDEINQKAQRLINKIKKNKNEITLNNTKIYYYTLDKEDNIEQVKTRNGIKTVLNLI